MARESKNKDILIFKINWLYLVCSKVCSDPTAHRDDQALL